MTNAALTVAAPANSNLQRQYVLLGNLVLALAVIGYPLSVTTAYILDIEGDFINISYRFLIVLLSTYLLMWSLIRGDFRLDFLIIFFFFIYTLRMLIDFFYSGIPTIDRHFQFYLATVLVPTLAMGGSNSWYDEKSCLKLIVALGGIAGAGVAYLTVFRPDEILSEALENRAALQSLNPISISYHGLYIATAAAIMIAKRREHRSLVFCGGIAILGVYLLIAGGSRGPFVALLLGLLITGIANARTARVYALFGVGGAVLLAYVGAPELILGRFISVGEDASSVERFHAANLSIEAAINHPLLGYRYIEPTTGSYPHNLIVEAAMALGLGGAALMLWMLSSLLTRAWQLARRGESLLPFLAACTFSNAWISGSIWGSGLFFITIFILRLKPATLLENDIRRQSWNPRY